MTLAEKQNHYGERASYYILMKDYKLGITCTIITGMCIKKVNDVNLISCWHYVLKPLKVALLFSNWIITKASILAKSVCAITMPSLPKKKEAFCIFFVSLDFSWGQKWDSQCERQSLIECLSPVAHLLRQISHNSIYAWGKCNQRTGAPAYK